MAQWEACVHAVSILLQISTVLLFGYKFSLSKYSTVLQKCVCEREMDFTVSIQNLYCLMQGEKIDPVVDDFVEALSKLLIMAPKL
jgi:hypothetical protein